ncbi:hypothetical protein FXO38_36177 [Capsicum annuum]|nr:hypothetical protein FXO38_36177 [Capsicum annuum]
MAASKKSLPYPLRLSRLGQPSAKSLSPSPSPGVPHGKTPQLPSPYSSQSIYTEAIMIEPSIESTDGFTNYQPDNHHRIPNTSGLPTNFLVRSVPFKLNSPTSSRMGREASHNSNPGSSIPIPASHGKPELGPTYFGPNVWMATLFLVINSPV